MSGICFLLPVKVKAGPPAWHHERYGARQPWCTLSVLLLFCLAVVLGFLAPSAIFVFSSWTYVYNLAPGRFIYIEVDAKKYHSKIKNPGGGLQGLCG